MERQAAFGRVSRYFLFLDEFLSGWMKQAGHRAFFWPEDNEIDESRVRRGSLARQEYFIVARVVIGIEPPFGVIPHIFVVFESSGANGAEFHLIGVSGFSRECLKRANRFCDEIKHWILTG